MCVMQFPDYSSAKIKTLSDIQLHANVSNAYRLPDRRTNHPVKSDIPSFNYETAQPGTWVTQAGLMRVTMGQGTF